MTEENIKLEEQLENAQPVTDEPAVEAPAVETPAVETPVEEAPKAEKKEKQPKVKKEKKPCKLVTFFANAKNGGDLAVKCLLMLLISAALAYAALFLWGAIDKAIPTFYNGAYYAVGTMAAILLAGIVLIILMIVRFAKAKKK